MNANINKFNFTAEQVAKFIKMQDELNTYIHSDWKSQGFDWLVAQQDEIMEIRGHLGWKWWKVGYLQGLTESNKAQVKLEVIDLLHFLISDWFADDSSQYLLETFNSPSGPVEIGYCLNKYMEFAAGNRGDVTGECWVKLAHCVGLTEQEIIETYTQKYVLNKFRQDHGYKDGSYIKEWQFRIANEAGIAGIGVSHMEDNEVLAEIVRLRKAAGHDATNEKELYDGLEMNYNSRLNK